MKKRGIFLTETAVWSMRAEETATFSNIHRADPLFHCYFEDQQDLPPQLHFSREWSSSSAVRAVKNPPAFPPFLHLMKTRGEDIRPSISGQSTSHVFQWISAHVLSPASSGGIVLPGLISIPQRKRTMEAARTIRRWQAMPRDRPPTPWCLMMW